MGVAELPQILLQHALYMYACTIFFLEFYSTQGSALSETHISLIMINTN